ncbi:MAG: hypothetical protein COA44_00615 [Arcobacter sp.]|nr:MAG: hypothetical protein COA44_00615 [Arcobacter sp.]
MNKPKIMICHYAPHVISGAERAMLDMVLPLQDVFDFTMFVAREDILSKFYREQGLKVHVQALSNKRRKFPGLHSFHSILLKRYLKNNPQDLLLCNTFFAANKMTTVARMTGIPMAIFVREYIDLNLPIHKHYINNAQAMFGVSQDVADYLKPAHKRVYTMHDYLDTSAISKVKKDVKTLEGDAPKVAIIGRVTPYKQQDLFVEAFPYVQAKVPNVEFYVIGESSKKEQPYKQKMINVAKQISKKIFFLGNRNDVYELLPQFDVSCMVSDREPFPRTVLESQFLKVPVVASNAGGVLEMIEDGVSGLFFDVSKRDPKLLAKKIIEVLEDKEASASRADIAHDRLMKSFATLAPIDNFKMILNELVGERK